LSNDPSENTGDKFRKQITDLINLFALLGASGRACGGGGDGIPVDRPPDRAEFAVEGADLFLCATGLEKLRETRTIVSEFGGRTELTAADVSEPDEVERLFDAAVSAFGRIDIVVNNAGIYKPARFLDYTPEVFDRIMRVNTYGVFHVMQRAVRHMLDNGAGMIVNITSTAGKWESPNQSA
jgi:NAD(P)-dependent dehydrogenase (short-subunit alcohol dehydrogenase family)